MRKVYILFVLATVVFLSNSSLHPSGNTNAPGDSFCANCHNGNGGSLDGQIAITGLPTTIQHNTTYSLTVTVSNPSTNAVRAGFQILALDDNDDNVGTFSNNSPSSALRNQFGRTYLGHNPAVPFNGNATINWTTDWTSPAAGSGLITVYGASVIANGNGANSGDRAVFSTTSGNISGGVPLSVSVTANSQTLCADSNDGSATAAATGGQPNYTYLWDNGEANAQANALNAGPHMVTVTDANNTTAVGSVTISSPTPLVSSVASVNDVICFGEHSGIAQIQASGGSPTYSYSWSDGGSGATRTNLSVGFYEITVLDNNGCESISTLTIDQPDEITAPATIQNINCSSAPLGNITVNAQGGVGTLQYSWSNGETESSNFELEAGIYFLTITDQNNCARVFNYEVLDANLPLISIISTNDALCYNAADGEAELSISGGSSNYIVTWSDNQEGTNRSDLAAGEYTITVVDDNGCSGTTSLEIGSPAQIIIDSLEAIPSSCPGVNDGSLEVQALGGVGQLVYNWPNNVNVPINNNITAGSYTVTVTDFNNCIATKTLVLGSLSNTTITVNDQTNVSCNGGNDGTASVNISNGNDYIITWSNGATGDVVSNLPAATYTVLAQSSSSSCTSNTLTIEITEPLAIIVDSASLIHPTCFGDNNGTISVQASGGVTPLRYVWSIGDTTNTLSDLEAGTYVVTISDASNCPITDTFYLTQPAALTIDTAMIAHLTCHSDSSGSIQLEVSGGTGNVTYQWSNGDSTSAIDFLQSGDYNVEIRDENNCSLLQSFSVTEPAALIVTSQVTNESVQGASDGMIKTTVTGGNPGYSYLWNTGATNDSITGLSSGNYKVTVTDTSGCTAVKNSTLINGDCALEADFTTKNVSCNNGKDGSIILSIINNLGDVSIEISGGQTDLSTLPAGNFSVTITDTAFCTITLDDILITEPSPISIDSFYIQDLKCPLDSSGAIDIFASGGTGGLEYNWSNGHTSSSLQMVFAGNYFVEISDMNNCSVTDSFIITEPTLLEAKIDSITPSEDFPNGAIGITPFGGTPPYSFQWLESGNTTTISTDEDLINVVGGFYDLVLTDANGCVFKLENIEITFINATADIENNTILYPSPVHDLLFIKSDYEISAVELLSTNGKRMHTATPNNTEYTINTSNLTKGMYLVRLKIATSNKTYRIIVE